MESRTAAGVTTGAGDGQLRLRGRADRAEERDGERVFHTYSTYARGGEALGGSHYFLDMTALGRQEEWEEPRGRALSARAAVPDFSD